MVFDAGVVIVASHGRVAATEPERPDILGRDWSDRGYFRQMLRSGEPVFSDIVADGPQGADVVVVAVPITGGQGEFRGTMAGMFRLGVVVPALVVTLGVRRITGPIAKLIAASRAVAEGSFGRTITVRTGDELEELATQFNLMSAQLQESYAGLEKKVADRTRELATLNAVAAVVSRSLDLQDVLRDALEKTLQSIGIEAGGIYLLDEKSETLSIAAHRGLSPQFLAQIDGLRVGEGFSGHVARTSQPLVVPDVSTDPRLARRVPGEEWRFSLVSVPLSARGKVLGTLFATADANREFAGQEVQLLISIGNQIGVAIENALLYHRAQQLAVMEERNRLARDLHDSVTQAVYGVTLYAEAAARLLSSGQVAAAASHLHELRSTAQQALREMRCLIFELRPPLLEKEGLVAALQARLERWKAGPGCRRS